MQYIVTQTIVSGAIDAGASVDVQWYKGERLAGAIAAMAQAATHRDDTPHIPESIRVHVLGVRLDMEADCPWRDQPGPTRPAWAQVACSGREVETEVGTLCAAHHTAMRGMGETQDDASYMADRGLYFEWADDFEVTHTVEYPDAYMAEPDTCEMLTLRDRGDDVVDSLGCVDDATDAYRRECEANMLAEYRRTH